MAITIGRLSVSLRTNTKGFNFKGAKKRLANFKRSLDNVGTWMQGLGKKMTIVSGAMMAPLAIATRSFSKTGDEVAKMAKRTGIGVQSIAELGHVANLAGANLEDVEKGV